MLFIVYLNHSLNRLAFKAFLCFQFELLHEQGFTLGCLKENLHGNLLLYVLEL